MEGDRIEMEIKMGKYSTGLDIGGIRCRTVPAGIGENLGDYAAPSVANMED